MSEQPIYEELLSEDLPDTLAPWLACRAFTVPYPEPTDKPHPVGWYFADSEVGPVAFLIAYGETKVAPEVWWSTMAHELGHHHLHRDQLTRVPFGALPPNAKLSLQTEADQWVVDRFGGEWWFEDLRPYTDEWARMEGVKP